MKETFGQKLARLRKAKGLTQEDIAKELFVSPQAVSKWENDITSPDISALVKLADLLGVSVDELLGHNSDEKEEENHQDLNKKDEDEEDDDDDDDKDERKPTLFEVIFHSSFFGICLLAYILLGILWQDQNMGWAMGWLLLLLPIVVGSVFNAFKKKSFCHFAYPVFIVIVYLTLGFLGNYYDFNGWGYWFLFITIPAYYLIFGPIDRYLKDKRN